MFMILHKFFSVSDMGTSEIVIPGVYLQSRINKLVIMEKLLTQKIMCSPF